MMYAKRISSTVVELSVNGKAAGRVVRDNHLTIALSQPAHYLQCKVLLDFLVATVWSDYMYVTSTGYVYGVTADEFEVMFNGMVEL